MAHNRDDVESGTPYSVKTGTIFSVAMVVLSAVLMSLVFYVSMHSLAFLPLIVPSTFPFGIACKGLGGLRRERA